MHRYRTHRLPVRILAVVARSQEEYLEMQRVELISRREDLKHKQENSLLSARIQQAFGRIRSQVHSKYGMNVEWLKIRCGNGNCSY